MYDHLSGTLAEKQPTRAVVAAAGVGYELTIPLTTFESLPEPGSEVVVHTHLHVREDSLRLFGFATRDERRFFRRLLDVSGIGPAVALSILSSTTYAEFRTSIVAEDVVRLTKMKGVGKKLAQRMVLELRDDLAKEAPGDDAGPPRPADPRDTLRDDALAALTTLGFTRGQAMTAVDKVLAKDDAPTDPGEVIRQALGTAR
ncbi:MAG: Holliday junction branch migration protein RuvA [Planctomycetota bacterium]